MDRISAVLLTGIIVLSMTSLMIIYETWISGAADEPQISGVALEEKSCGDLIFNDDTSVRNNSASHLWVRAKVIYRAPYDPMKYDIVSKAIEKGRWVYGDEGWYYYATVLDFAQTTDPLIDELLYDGEVASEGGSGSFSLQVEAVDSSAFREAPNDGEEAFKLMERSIPRSDRLYL